MSGSSLSRMRHPIAVALGLYWPPHALVEVRYGPSQLACEQISGLSKAVETTKGLSLSWGESSATKKHCHMTLKVISNRFCWEHVRTVLSQVLFDIHIVGDQQAKHGLLPRHRFDITGGPSLSACAPRREALSIPAGFVTARAAAAAVRCSDAELAARRRRWVTQPSRRAAASTHPRRESGCDGPARWNRSAEDANGQRTGARRDGCGLSSTTVCVLLFLSFFL